MLGGLVVLLLGDLLTLPFAAWRHTVAVKYGISNQSWSGWTIDLLKSYAVGAVLGGLVLLGFYTVVRLAPRWWWAFGAAGAFLLVVLLSFVLPVVVEPVFNKFTPMADGPLRSELLATGRARRRPGPRRPGRRRVPPDQRGERLRVRVRADPAGSSSTTRC